MFCILIGVLDVYICQYSQNCTFKWVKYVNYTSMFKKKFFLKFQFSCQQTVFKLLSHCFYKFSALLLIATRWQNSLHQLDKCTAGQKPGTLPGFAINHTIAWVMLTTTEKLVLAESISTNSSQRSCQETEQSVPVCEHSKIIMLVCKTTQEISIIKSCKFIPIKRPEGKTQAC